MGTHIPSVELKDEDFIISGNVAGEAEELSGEPIGYWRDAWRRLRKNKVAMAALVILILIGIMVVIGPLIRGMDYITMAAGNKNAEPSSEFWWGADNLGRDMFSRVWAGARVSFVVAIACTGIQIVFGSLYGGIMGYLGGWADEVMMRILEIITSLPSLLLTILVMVALGNNVGALLLAMCIASWCPTARQVRGQVLQLKQSEYVMAAEALGVKPIRIIVRHLLPNTMGIIILDVASSIPGYIFQEAYLSFIGLGLQQPSISLGLLVSSGQAVMNSHFNQLAYPCLVLCAMVLAFNILGDGLRNALDPRFRK